MSRFTYTRSKVPVGQEIILEVAFTDSAGNPKDTETYPSVEILDASMTVVRALSANGVYRPAVGRYRLNYIIPDSFDVGLWNDRWVGTLDGYEIENIFDFTVDSVGSIEATGISIPERIYSLSDDDIEEDFTQEEIKGILRLRKYLKAKMRSVAYKPDGTMCPIMPDDQLDLMLCSALSEFNATPTLTAYGFDSQFLQTVGADIITQGAMLIAWSGQAVIEAGFEFTVQDNGVTYNPPPVSSTISSMYSTQLSDYRTKLARLKLNLKGAPRGMSAGGFLNSNRNVRVMRMRHLKEKRLY